MKSDQSIEFLLNCRKTSVIGIEPTTLLVDYLHRPEVGLTGTKKACGQGGCGACTVMLSRYDDNIGEVVHTSINSCMRPLAALDRMAITTTEHCGNTRDGVSKVQWQIAADNGSQCGYCTAGWVMNMHSYLVSKGTQKPSKQEIESIFDGNICRCTGYRPILYAMQHFAEGFEPHRHAMSCQIDPAEAPILCDGPLVAPTIPKDWEKLRELHVEGIRHKWFRPLTLASAQDLIEKYASFNNLKLLVGNTSIGVYDRYVEDPTVYIDIGHVQELRSIQSDDKELSLGAAVTYTELLAALTAAIERAPADRRSMLKALHYMAGRTAGHIVRNAASIAGNTMLVLRHIDDGIPFPSDMFTAYATAGVEVSIFSADYDGLKRLPILEFAADYATSQELRQDALIVQFHVPTGAPNEIAQTYKTALRKENSHSIANAGFRVRFGDGGNVKETVIVIGGIGPVAFRATRSEACLKGQSWPKSPRALVSCMTADVRAVMDDARIIKRMSDVPDEGFSDEYRLQLAESFAYKFWIETADELGMEVSASLKSTTLRKPRPISTGTQRYSTYKEEYPVNRPFVKLGAFIQACGEGEYVHDMPIPPRGLHARFVTSAAAKANFCYIDYDGHPIDVVQIVTVLGSRFDGIERYITGDDVPQANAQALPDAKGTAPQIDDPIFCLGRVTTHGQSIGLVLASDPVVAEAAAHDVSTKLIRYEREQPLLTIDEALAATSVFQDAGPKQFYPSHIWKIRRPNANVDWDGALKKITLDDEPCEVVESQLHVGSQIHFYMETQSAMAVPGEDGAMVVHSSTQSPDSVQSLIREILKKSANKVQVRNKRVGGAYGGKTTRSPRPAAAVAVASHVTQRPVHLAMRRETDTAMIGHRHPVQGAVCLAIATGEGDENRGKIMGLQADFVMNGGNTYDASFTMSNVMQLRCDSAYMVPHYETTSDVAQTNIASNGAFRSVGCVQGVLIIEDAIEKAAIELNIPAEIIRGESLYELGDTVPDGQRLDYCYLRDVWNYTLNYSSYKERLEEVDKFNRENKWVKRGISIIPVKYGAGYNASFLEQAGALIEVYSEDGSILVRQGGVEIGQGLRTKIAQVAAKVLNVPLNLIYIAELDTGVVPNPVSTGASTGTSFNATAVKEACDVLRERVQDYALNLLAENGDKWCGARNIDYWNYKDQGGWRCKVDGKTMWQNIISMAHKARVNLSAQTRAAIKGGEAAIPKKNLLFKKDAAPMEIDAFTGFTYSAACTEVEIDILTGVTNVLRADIVYDMGESINPAVDIGQVEGAFIQGLGYVTTEKLVWQETGPDRGVANTLNTWTYKPPAHTSIPEIMNVDLFPRREAESVHENPDLLYSSKEVGEPPLVLATTVFLAIKRAIAASRKERGLTPWAAMNSPATVQAIREACEVSAEELSE